MAVVCHAIFLSLSSLFFTHMPSVISPTPEDDRPLLPCALTRDEYDVMRAFDLV